MPIRRIFGFLFNIKEQARSSQSFGNPAFPKKLNYHLRVRDRFWGWIYQPIADSSFWIARKVGMLQQGKIHIYLIYSFVTIIILLVFFR